MILFHKGIMMKSIIESHLKNIKQPILINNVIGGDGTEVYVEFKGRGSRFINDHLSSNINSWLGNLPKISIDNIQYLIAKYQVTLNDISQCLEDEELSQISDVERWVNVYNNQDDFLPIESIERIVKSNIAIIQ